jgi:hypothetical protein
MPLLNQALAWLDAHRSALYLLAGLLSFLVAHRSQVDAWAEKNPRVAGLMKLLRGAGIDPWLILQGLSLVLLKRLPKPKDPPSTPPTVTNSGAGISIVALTFVLTFGVSFAAVVSCTSQKVPDAADAYAGLVQACKLYAFVPAEHHTPESDKACQAVTHLCDEVPAPAPTPTRAPEDAGVLPSAPVDADAGQ